MNFLTELKEGLAISWDAIRANKMRSVLTTLGIVIGIVTVTLMTAAIQGLDGAFANSISFIGADVLYVSRNSWFIQSREEWMRMMKRRVISLDQAQSLERQLTLASAVAPVADDNDSVRYKKRRSDSVRVLGSTEAYQQTAGVTLSQGRFFSPSEASGGRPVCVLGFNVASNLFQGEAPLGNRIRIDQTMFEVIGVMEKQGGMFEIGGVDDEIIVPLRQFLISLWSHPDYDVQIKVRDLGHLDDAREELRGVMRRIRHLAPADPDDFAINQQDQFLDMFHKISGTIAGVGLFITGLSLFVGGIGIMNIMFVSVAERTREIGVRKAIGARRRTILLQFLAEAATICLIGGGIGLLIAWPMTLLIRKFLLPAPLSLSVVGLALLVSLLTGVVSGFLPAWRAARMNPVDALRTGD
jgi:putative ABC transport system permease protein